MDSVFISRLKEKLLKTKKSQKEQAEDMKISIGVLRNARCGYSSPATRATIAEYLGLTVKYLFGAYK